MTEKEEEKVPLEIANELEKFAELLDPHLADFSDVETSASTERWSALKATIFIFGTSLILWALVTRLDLLTCFSASAKERRHAGRLIAPWPGRGQVSGKTGKSGKRGRPPWPVQTVYQEPSIK